MNLQAQRLQVLCEGLNLPGLEVEYEALAQTATDADSSYTDYLEQCLKAEQQSRQQRTRSVLLKMAGFPAVKQLHAYDFKFAVGAPKKQIEALASLSFISVTRISCYWDRQGWGKPTSPLHWGIWQYRPGSKPVLSPRLICSCNWIPPNGKGDSNKPCNAACMAPVC